MVLPFNIFIYNQPMKAMKQDWKSISIDNLIKLLQAAQEKGGNTAQLKGTIMIPEIGNFILLSTEKQS